MKQTLTILLILVALTSCNLAKKVVAPAQAAKPDSTLVANDVIDRVQQAEPHFNSLNIPKFDLSVQFGQGTYTLRGSLRMITDSVISISIQPMLGIEVARIDLFTDYFSVYDKMNHRYSETAYEDFTVATGIPFDYNYLQSVITARFHSIPYRSNQSYSLAEHTDSTYVIVGNDNLNGLSQYFEVYFGTFHLALSGMQRGKSQALPYAVYYSDWRILNRKYSYPFNIRIEVDHKKFFFEAKARIDDVVEFDGKINITQINLERYKRVPFSSYFTEQEI